MSAKIAVSSSVTWLIGCTRPDSADASRTGNVTSIVSVLSLASSAAVASLSFAAAMATVTRSFNPLMAGPWTFRSSGVIVPRVFRSAETEPLLPSAATRTASSVASSFAEATLARISCSSDPMFDMAHHRVMRELDPRILSRLALCPPKGLCRQCSFGFFHDRLKRCRFADGKIRQHLAINGQPGLSQSGNEPAVVQSERPDRCVETLDPERAESALAPFAVAEGVLVCLLDRLLRDTDRILATAVVALGGLQNLLVFSVRRDTTLYAGHGKSPCRTSE